MTRMIHAIHSRHARRDRRLSWLAAVTSTLLLVMSAYASTDQDLENRFANVQRLIETSSGAQRVQDSDSAEARARRQQARALLELDEPESLEDELKPPQPSNPSFGGLFGGPNGQSNLQ